MTATITALPTWPEDVPVHPAAELFPLMGGAEFDELVEDVRENGLVSPIVRTPEGLILDGRNRYRACLLADVEPSFETHAGEPWQFVISTNLHRRHLTDSQRAMVAARIADLSRGGYRHGVKTSDEVLTHVPTHKEAARLLSVSEAQIDRARVVHKRGTEALKVAVEAGAVPVTTAARVSALPADKQDEFVERVAAGAKPTEVAPPPAKPAPLQPQPEAVAKAEPRSTAEERAARIAELAPRGLTSRQIADEVGVSDEYVRTIARKFNVEIPADVVVNRSRRVDSNRVVRETVHTLEGLSIGLSLINPSDLDRSEIENWSKSLTESIRAVNRLIKQMKELDQ